MSAKLAWELTWGIYVRLTSPDRNICSCTSAPMVTYTEMGTVDLGPHGLLRQEFSLAQNFISFVPLYVCTDMLDSPDLLTNESEIHSLPNCGYFVWLGSSAKTPQFLQKFPVALIWSPTRPNRSPKMMPTWLYHQHAAKSLLNRHYNACVISWHKFFYAFFIEGCRLCLQPVGNIFFQLFAIVEVFTGKERLEMTATAGSDVVQSGRPIFDDFFQHLWPYIGSNTANVVFQIVKRLCLIRIDQ
ncbi:hypothetical protein TNCV_4150341 [Trichonephila clavipes]|uniref:Uncharacterized protein n=1 Tax=Trichonephila clavipes TaxID=2585209 RepID=A0A8X6W5H2_TRICX|nr:hypothetical protein TNCV_4150341 [Trichonephila clavipes]